MFVASPQLTPGPSSCPIPPRFFRMAAAWHHQEPARQCVDRCEFLQASTPALRGAITSYKLVHIAPITMVYGTYI